jgi:hypothetical protein
MKHEDIKPLFETINDIETLSFKLGSIHGMAILLAERLTDEAESSVAWAIADMAGETGDKMGEQIDKFATFYRLALTKKGKK